MPLDFDVCVCVGKEHVFWYGKVE